ncbi:hypothetical protein NPIL_423831 [Nephila pilipes]|uniref:Uncharacterized protein n=1 Tax=Nephila pilipes TaxID=299642 RepID=A0A8X6TT36_NEPPI|nr:hypothetical protein NPIL_423831 [Nephila pilipes]
MRILSGYRELLSLLSVPPRVDGLLREYGALYEKFRVSPSEVIPTQSPLLIFITPSYSWPICEDTLHGQGLSVLSIFQNGVLPTERGYFLFRVAFILPCFFF